MKCKVYKSNFNRYILFFVYKPMYYTCRIDSNTTERIIFDSQQEKKRNDRK